MICRYIITTFIAVLPYIMYGQENYYKPKYFAVLDSTQGEQLLDQCSRNRPDSVVAFWTVRKLEKQLFLHEFKKIISISEAEVITQGPKAWKKYCFQVVGFRKSAGKYIYLNAFNISSQKENFKSGIWKKIPVTACGGGDWYWGAVYDVERKTFIEVDVNVGH